MMRKLLLLQIFLWPSLLLAQPKYRFEQLPADIGLPHSAVNCMVQDSRGVLWVGTWSGLMRYDGYRVKIYHQEPGNAHGLQSDQVTALIEDREHRLWVGTVNAGFHCFDRATEQFRNYRFNADDANSLSDNDVWGLFEDSKGYIWVGTKNGLNRFDPKTGNFLRIFSTVSGKNKYSADYIYSICETSDGSIWSATTRGLNRIQFTSRDQYSLQHYELDPSAPDTELGNFIYRIRPARQEANTLWVASKAGLWKVKFSDSDRNYLKIAAAHRTDPANRASLSHNIVSDFFEDKNGALWVATYHGLNLLDPKTGQFRRFLAQPNEPFSLNNDFVRCLYRDRTGILWIGTDKGLNKLNLRSKPFHSVRLDKFGSAAGSVVTGISNGTTPGVLWVSTIGGLHRFDARQQLPTPVHYTLQPPQLADFANFTTNVWRDAAGWLWITTQGAGLLRIHENALPPGGGRVTGLEQWVNDGGKSFLNDNYVMQVYDSGEERLWFGLWDGGLELYNRNTRTIRHFQAIGELNLMAFPNVALAETREGNRNFLWVGTRGNGLLKLAIDPADNSLRFEQHFHFIPGQKGCLSNDKVNMLLVDSKGWLWVCTSAGLDVLEPGSAQFRTFSQSDGLPNLVIQGVAEDASGQFWVSTQTGIAHLVWTRDTSKAKIRTFDLFDGLQDNFFSSNCALHLPDNRLAFGGAEGLSLFAPGEIRTDSVPPLTIVSDFLLFNKPVPIGKMENGREVLTQSITETNEIQLKYWENVLSFEFAALHFAEPKKNRFAYKLEGFDQDWVYTSAEKRFAHYTNLPYRDFIFWVKSANGDDVWGEPTAIKVCVAPPFWLTWWAYCIYGILFVVLIYGVWRITHLRAEFRNRLALERVEREKLEEVNQLKLQFFTNISHELRTPMTLIVTPLEQMLRESSANRALQKTLSLMHQNAGKMLTMISQLLDFRKSEAGLMQVRAEKIDLVGFMREIALSFKPLAQEHAVDLKFEPENESIVLWFDPDQMEKVFFNLFSNALKFTPDGGVVRVVLAEIPDKNSVEISVSDTGPGIAPQELERIFDPFHQGTQQPGRPIFGGTGIGLSLAKAIVEQHSGSIRAANIESGGAAFIINLPLGDAHFSPEQRVEPGLEHTRNQAFLSADTDVHSGTAPATTAKPTKRRHILLVEDNADIRSYLREHLEHEYKISEASNGVEALTVALEHAPDLVLTDISMPEMDGIDLCRRLKTDVHTSHIPVVLLTARTSLIHKMDGLETGADDYLTKPFNLHLLMLRIRNLIEIREKLRDKFSKSFDLSPSGVTVTSLDEEFLQRLIQVVEAHMDENEFSIDDLAREIAMSRIQLYRKLKALTGTTPNNFIRSIRLKRAAQLLSTGQFNVSEVAYKVGFTDLKYFRERFREHFGIVPSEYGE
ncbi:MAG: response regulator [Saprospiraceae bacterium]|nr:response regulator [Saprospiraceae bacterium]